MLYIAWSVNVIAFIFGLFLIFKTEYFYNISWYAKHKVDETGKNYVIVMMRFSGVALVIAVIIWSIKLLIY